MIHKIKNIFKRQNKPQEQRNYAISDMYISKLGQPVYTTWTVRKAVNEGYKINGWVYRAVYLKAKAISSVPWVVVNNEGEHIEGHYLSQLLSNPNPHISRQDLFELMTSWLELAGNSYLNKVKSANRTSELWPISPDRLHPIPSKDITEWMAGYALDESRKPDFEPEEIIHHKYFNPANPLLGISPLEAAAKAVDTDVDQQDWNKAAMQNRGVLDGVFAFEREFQSQKDTNDVAEALNERYAGKNNARRIGVVGSNAKYYRTALSPVELYFMESRKFNREEIFIIFGVPPVYAGVSDNSTFNNYQTSELIFWFSTIIPLLDDLRDTFNFSFSDELGQNEKISYDLNNIPAIRKALYDKTETAEKLFKMGVPFDQINKIFQFGVDEYAGWDISYPGNPGNLTTDKETDKETDQERSIKKYTLIEKRQADTEDKIEETAQNIISPVFEQLLEKQRKAVFADIEKTNGDNVQDIIEKDRNEWIKTLTGFYLSIGKQFGSDIVLEKRQAEDDLGELIEQYLENEGTVLKEVSFISETTTAAILQQVREGLAEGASIPDIQQAIIDVGVLSPERALMLARTVTGTAANLGQLKGAELTGATHKKWLTAGFEVRDSHKEMQNKKVKTNEYFKVGSKKRRAQFPLDPRLPPKERVNCRCTMTFSIED